MLKTAAAIVVAAIVAVLGADIYLVATCQATTNTFIELAVGAAATLALAVTGIVRGIRALIRNRGNSYLARRIEELSDKVDDLKYTVEQQTDTISELESKVDSLKDSLPESPDAWQPAVNTEDSDGKIHLVYTLPNEGSFDEALQAARDSVKAREDEGQPVTNPRITVNPVFY